MIFEEMNKHITIARILAGKSPSTESITYCHLVYSLYIIYILLYLVPIVFMRYAHVIVVEWGEEGKVM